VISDVHDGNGSIPEHQLYPAGLPWGGLTSIDNGLEFSTAAYDFTQNRFRIGFEHIGNSTSVSWPSSKAKRQFCRTWGGLYFSVDVETPYKITGGYNSIGKRRAFLIVGLADTSGGRYFENTQDSRASTSVVLVIGEQNGDTYNSLLPSQTGILYPGRVYSLIYEFRVENYGPAPDWVGVARAEGYLILTLITPVPGDIDDSGCADLEDFALFAPHWQRTNCGFCGGADFTGDGAVGWDDLQQFAANWLSPDL
jgi:hypothetical protein